MNYVKLLSGSAGTDTSSHPLTHHEILGLVQPFTRRGFQVDLAASDRINRRLIFKPAAHADEDGAAAGEPGGQTDDQRGDRPAVTIQLDNPRPGWHLLTRTATHDDGFVATLETQGDDLSVLLQRIETVPPEQQFRDIEGTIVALSYRLTPAGRGHAGAGAAVNRELLRGDAEIAGFRLALRAAQVKGYPVEIDITPNIPGVMLPEDLLAVLGWAWTPLRKSKAGWSGRLKVRGHEPALSRDIEARLDKTVTHLVHTLTKPPAAYHDALVRARWGVALRRAMPLMFFGGLIAGAASLTLVEIPQDSIINLLLMGAPPLLMFGAFGMRDTPSLEVPPLPRRSTAASWFPEREQPAQTMDVQAT